MYEQVRALGALCNGWVCHSWNFQYREGIIRIVFVPHLYRNHRHGEGEPLMQVAWNACGRNSLLSES